MELLLVTNTHAGVEKENNQYNYFDVSHGYLSLALLDARARIQHSK